MAPNSKKRILIADKDALNAATLIGTLKDAYLVATAQSAHDIDKQLTMHAIDMILLDTRLPDASGIDICRKLKQTSATANIPIIFVTSDNRVSTEADAFKAGADDFIARPFNAPIVLARIKNQFKLSDAFKELRQLHQLALDANPNTQLPGNNSVLMEIERALSSRDSVCIVYADLDNFKPFNDHYGFAKGDDVIAFTANVIRVALQQHGCANAFLGHIGGDDFVFSVASQKCAQVCQDIVRRIDEGIPQFYNDRDRHAGYIIAEGRDGEEKRYPLISLSMGGVDLSKRTFSNVLEVVDICTETKSAAKKQPGSNLRLCQRQQLLPVASQPSGIMVHEV